MQDYLDGPGGPGQQPQPPSEYSPTVTVRRITSLAEEYAATRAALLLDLETDEDGGGSDGSNGSGHAQSGSKYGGNDGGSGGGRPSGSVRDTFLNFNLHDNDNVAISQSGSPSQSCRPFNLSQASPSGSNTKAVSGSTTRGPAEVVAIQIFPPTTPATTTTTTITQGTHLG